MGIGTGIFLIAIGAALSWAIDVDLPYVEDDAVGLILILAGIAVAVVSAILTTDHPEAGVGTGIVLFAAGAVLAWAIQVDVPYVADYAMGAILMAAGAISVLATLIVGLQRRREHPYHDRYHQPPAMPDRY